MFKKIPLWIGFLILPFFILGCVTTGTIEEKPTETVKKEGLLISPPDRQISDMTQQPAHIKLVIAAIVNKMRGDRNSIPQVNFISSGKHAFYDTNFTYEGFDLNLIQITGFKVLNENKKVADLVIEGVLNFKDVFGRGAANYFAAAYTVKTDGININKSATALIAPTIPDVEVFYVPKDSFDTVNMNEMSSFMDLYLHAGINAVNMKPTQEDQKNKNEFDNLTSFKRMFAKNPTEAGEYYVMAFCKDRLPPDAELEMKITDKPEMKGKTILETGYVYDQGWRVMLSGGKFRPNDLKKIFHITTRYKTNSNPKSKYIILGRYTNQKNYNETPEYIIKQKPAVAVQAVPKPAQPITNPIESGKVFLSLVDSNDAKLVQTQLKKMGYYTKKIDGAFGKGSKKALEDFRADNGLSNDVIWNVEIQKLLFRNSGL